MKFKEFLDKVEKEYFIDGEQNEEFWDDESGYMQLLNEDNTYFYNEFSHIDINMMCVFNRLEDLKLSEVITTNKTPLLQKYWKNLQKRDSYKKGILNYYTSKEHKVIKDFYNDAPSPFLKPILVELAQRN